MLSLQDRSKLRRLCNFTRKTSGSRTSFLVKPCPEQTHGALISGFAAVGLDVPITPPAALSVAAGLALSLTFPTDKPKIGGTFAAFWPATNALFAHDEALRSGLRPLILYYCCFQPHAYHASDLAAFSVRPVLIVSIITATGYLYFGYLRYRQGCCKHQCCKYNFKRLLPPGSDTS